MTSRFRGRGRGRGSATLERWFPAAPAEAGGYVDGSTPPVSSGAPSQPVGAKPVFVVWHKWSDLRLSDNEPVTAAHAQAAQAGGQVLHVYVLEKKLIVGRSRVSGVPRCGDRRACFWRESVEDLAKRLHASGQTLLTVTDASRGGLAATFEHLCLRFSIRTVHAHRELCDEELKAEAVVKAELTRHGAALELHWGGLTVHHIDDLGLDPGDKRQMPSLYQPFLKHVRSRPVRKPAPSPSKLRGPPDLTDDVGYLGEAGVVQAFASVGAPLSWTPPPDGIGLRQDVQWIGGETAALAHLRDYVWESGKLKNYVGCTDSMTPGENNAVNSGTRLSPWLAFGCVSARAVVHEVRRYERAQGKTRNTYWVYHELIFRDFFRFSALLWGSSMFKLHGPYNVRGLEWRRDLLLLEKWQKGQTGFPFVDAGMRELAATGYISHLHRQTCAAFLVRDLRLDWRMGAEVFESYLLDHTPDANWGNWAYRILQRPQLVANGCPVIEHVTTVEVIAWPVVHDSRLDHILAWLPELRGLPRDQAREPWRLETSPQQRIKVQPFKDSPLWFCSVNRVNWQEYDWLSGFAWTVVQNQTKRQTRSGSGDFVLGRDYPKPLVPPLEIEVDLDRVPVAHAWGDTPQAQRPHVWGKPGKYVGTPCSYPHPSSTAAVIDLVAEDEDGAAHVAQKESVEQHRPSTYYGVDGTHPAKQPRRRWVTKSPVV